MSLKKLYLLLIISILFGCSYNSKGIKYQNTSESGFMEVSDSESENLTKIKATKLNFTLQYSEDILAWERLVFFFNFYLKSPVKISKHQKTVEVVAPDKFTYTVKRKNTNNLIKYKVSVVESKTKKVSNNSNIKAKNLARFLSEGILDQNLL